MSIISSKIPYINSILSKYTTYKNLFENPKTQSWVNFETAKLYNDTRSKLIQLSVNYDMKEYIESQLGHSVNDIPEATVSLTLR